MRPCQDCDWMTGNTEVIHMPGKRLERSRPAADAAREVNGAVVA